MKCLYCEKDFVLSGKQGSQNRLFCYNCLPANLDRNTRNKIRRELYVKKASEEKKNLGCQKCGYNKYGAVLEWHHLDPTEKDFNLSDWLKKDSAKCWEQYKEETKKCILLCANCHREWHIEHD